MFAPPAGDVGEARLAQHRLALAARIVHHADFVVAEGDVEAHQRDAEAVDLVGVQADAIILIGQAFAESAHAEFPRPIAAHTMLHRCAEALGRQRVSPRARSEEHTSELQSLMRISYAVFCLKKKKTNHNNTHRSSTITCHA